MTEHNQDDNIHQCTQCGTVQRTPYGKSEPLLCECPSKKPWKWIMTRAWAKRYDNDEIGKSPAASL